MNQTILTIQLKERLTQEKADSFRKSALRELEKLSGITVSLLRHNPEEKTFTLSVTCSRKANGTADRDIHSLLCNKFPKIVSSVREKIASQV